MGPPAGRGLAGVSLDERVFPDGAGDQVDQHRVLGVPAAVQRRLAHADPAGHRLHRVHVAVQRDRPTGDLSPDPP